MKHVINPHIKEVRINRIELTPVYMPFNEVVKMLLKGSDTTHGTALKSEDVWLGGDFVICRIHADDGSVGLGEVFVWLPETGISPDTIISTIKKALGKYLIGESPFNIEKIMTRMNNNVSRNEVTKGLLDMACYDLMGRISHRSVCDLLGGRTVDSVDIAYMLPLTDVNTIIEFTKRHYAEGIHTIRFKLGKGVKKDKSMIEKIRNSMGDDLKIRVDYNQAYTRTEAVKAIKAIEPFDIEFVEQPVNATDFAGMAYVQKRVDTPIMAHEGCFSLYDIFTLAELGAIGIVGINSERPGGVTNALRAISFAESRGMGVVIHNQTLGIASAMQLHLAAARHNSLGHSVELLQKIFEDDLIINPLECIDGRASVPEGTGWGVELDEDSLRRYATGSSTIIE